MSSYATSDPIRVDVRIPAGRIEIDTTDAEETTVEVRRVRGGAADGSAEEVRQFLQPARGERQCLYVAVEQGRRRWSGRDAYEVLISTPHGAEVKAATGSASVIGTGRFQSVDVKTASGHVSFEDVAGDARIKSASGDVALGDVAGSMWAACASGDVRMRRVGDELTASLVSGHLSVDEADGDVTARTVSGDMSIRAVDRGRIQVTTVSGDTQILVRPGRRVWMDLVSASGDTTCELDGFGDEAAGAGSQADVEIRARSVSGDISIRRAEPSAAGAA